MECTWCNGTGHGDKGLTSDDPCGCCGGTGWVSTEDEDEDDDNDDDHSDPRD